MCSGSDAVSDMTRLFLVRGGGRRRHLGGNDHGGVCSLGGLPTPGTVRAGHSCTHTLLYFWIFLANNS